MLFPFFREDQGKVFVFQVKPTDDSGNEIGFFRELQDEIRLGDRLRSLNNNRLCNTGRPERRTQIVRQIVTYQNRNFWSSPRSVLQKCW